MPVTLLHCHIVTLLSKHEVHLNSLAGSGRSVVDDLSSPIVTANTMKNAAELAGMREAHGVSGPLRAMHLVTTCMPFSNMPPLLPSPLTPRLPSHTEGGEGGGAEGGGGGERGGG